MYYYNKRPKGCYKCRFRAMYNAWPNVAEAAQEKKSEKQRFKTDQGDCPGIQC